MTDVACVLSLLQLHRGAERGICAARLAGALGIEPRQLRRLITRARDDGHAICGLPSTGYYLPSTPNELRSACAFLRSRAMRSLRSLSRMQRVAMPELLGQLALDLGVPAGGAAS
jgi:predicted DNA-binding transcriptional regulator YafY